MTTWRETAERSTALAQRLFFAIEQINEILPPPGTPATSAEVNRIRVVLAGLDAEAGPV